MITNNLKITVVIGAGFKCLKQLQKSIETNKNKVDTVLDSTCIGL